MCRAGSPVSSQRGVTLPVPPRSGANGDVLSSDRPVLVDTGIPQNAPAVLAGLARESCR